MVLFYIVFVTQMTVYMLASLSLRLPSKLVEIKRNRFSTTAAPESTTSIKTSETWTTTTPAPLPPTTCTVDATSCGVCEQLTSTTGRLTSRNYPTSAYTNNLRCTYTIAAPPGKRLTLTFVNRFQLETCCDFVMVYNGVRADSSNLIKTMTGEILPAATIVSATSVMTIHFRTDSSTTLAGWEAIYDTI